MALQRWRMNRAGILNFWYYDEEEFQFEEGRLILRGTNGSGKSVTMQSFIPLVLDGDKRPERLDPFGSRDRKLEYYLLGDNENGHTERTGYLWLEFYHPAKNLYKTIGIGVRARRGAAQLGFWGFLLEDGRRINRDIYLYNRSLWIEQKSKIPLTRKELGDLIDSGGKVVQEQSMYREMVNEALFGFQDVDSYKDLLKLLLELRSPKLSKDFKPSSMYEILKNALPPIMEDDLNPLSDVIEDMDEITDRLDELHIHVKDMGKLCEKYTEYNQFLIRQHSEEVLNQYQVCESLEKEVNELNKKVQTTKDEQANNISSINHRKAMLKSIEAELDVLNRSEVIGKQRELEHAEEQFKETNKQLADLDERMRRNSTNLSRIKVDVAKAQDKIEQLVIERTSVIDELEDTARVLEFREHDIYHGMWLKGIPDDDRWSHHWIKDLGQHKEKLIAAHTIALEEREANRIASEAEINFGEIHRQRTVVEEEYRLQVNAVEITKESMRERLICWQQELNQLPVDQEALRDALRALSSITLTERQYERVRFPAVKAFKVRNQELLEQSLRLQHQKEVLQLDCSRLEQELKQWISAKEPEPARNERRSRTRELRRPSTGAPLFSVCEFNEILTENERARLEETLEQAGLLDAWIFPGGKVSKMDWEQEEEVWVEPTEKSGGSFLTDVLCATPSAESGLTLEDVQSALNSIGWETGYSDAVGNEEKLVIGKGGFRLGALTGNGFSKERAEYIGAETRRRTKQIAIAQLESNIELLVNEISYVDEQLMGVGDHVRVLHAELDAFPDDMELQEHLDTLVQLSYRLNEMMNQEQKVELQYKERMNALRKIQLSLKEITAEWSSLKNEKQIRDALDIWPHYRGRVSELHSLWLRYNEISEHQMNSKEQQNELILQLEEDEDQQLFLKEKNIKYEAQIRQLHKLMLEMGSKEIYEQLTKLKENKVTLNNQLAVLDQEKEQIITLLASQEAELRVRSHEYEKSNNQYQLSVELWKAELQLRLVQEWKEAAFQSSDWTEVLKVCRQIVRRYGAQFGNKTKERLGNELQQVYNAVCNNLREYVLELDFLFSGRIVIHSQRDRSNPLSPIVLLEELINQRAEQQVLLTEKDRELYEEIIIGSVGRAIRGRIRRAKEWVSQMDVLMKRRDTSSGLQLSLNWEPKVVETEEELPPDTLVDLLLRDAHRMNDEEIDTIVEHFRTRILKAKANAEDEQGTLRYFINEILDYRSWFEFRLYFRKGEQTSYKELTDSKFNVLSGGEKAMAMYIPLFAATFSRYSDAQHDDAPTIISLDEAFAGVDDANMRDMFELLTDMGFDYIMTSQVLWGCYDTVPRLAIYEIYRPKDARVVTLFHYRWNGKSRELVEAPLTS
ncbi:TIGR02680 family protein [Paenibacillus doosanensis]|uniref:TIGR02680 family protein n=1 Tax=Paenibacillus doosanensis TaxID=1229154 RepID=UPI00217FA20D|nr:TIGR02680 family protein [Paenibacillus doosanensis]MCS7463052.1 TIGR02680 family protein [Paenibacillus doosanensis]